MRVGLTPTGFLVAMTRDEVTTLTEAIEFIEELVGDLPEVLKQIDTGLAGVDRRAHALISAGSTDPVDLARERARTDVPSPLDSTTGASPDDAPVAGGEPGTREREFAYIVSQTERKWAEFSCWVEGEARAFTAHRDAWLRAFNDLLRKEFAAIEVGAA